jgi:signal transduction histidine kinase
VLVAFKNILRADSGAEILRLLADAAIDVLGAGGAVIVELLPTGEAKVVEARSVPEALRSFRAEVDVIDADLGERLRAETGFAEATTLPMMNGGDLFGALVLLFPDVPVTDTHLAEAQVLVDLAAISLGKARQYTELSRSYAELRASREILERTEKLRSLGEMAAGISHDLKNILNPLSLHLQLLKRIVKRGGAVAGAVDAIEEMEQVLRRGVETVERLRDFSRQSPEKRLEPVDLDALAHEAVELSRPRIASAHRPRGIWIVEELGRPPPIMARSAEMVNALVNLVVNAIDALGEGGTITVRSGASEGSAWISVHDDGPGIAEEHRERLFEPFFTTKGQVGTGLGLSMVYALAQRYGGRLAVESAPGLGTTFTLSFPTTQPGPSASQRSPR